MPAPVDREQRAVVAGDIPSWSHGPQPGFESYETGCLLSASDQDAHLSITVFFSDGDPGGLSRIVVPGRRTKHVLSSELQNSGAPPKATDDASAIAFDVPLAVQPRRLGSRQADHALVSTIAFSSNA